MTIRHLNVFIKVCECGYSISKASEELNVAQPSVSQTIKELESYYGVNLFNRANHKLLLTKEGEVLLSKAREVTNRFNEFETLANNKNLNPKVKIGATATFGVFIIPRFIELLREKDPNIEPVIKVNTPNKLEEDILLGNIDFALIEGLVKNDYINAYCLGEDELIGVTSTKSDIPNIVKQEDLNKYPLLVREKDNPARKVLDEHLSSKGIKIVNPKLESVSNSTICSLAAANEGIGILPRAVPNKWVKSGILKVIEFDKPIKRKLFLVTHKNKVMNSSTTIAYKLAKEILSIARKERDELNK